MSRQFTWWRRFHTTQKLQPEHFYKGASRLLQRIEAGEFEYDPLSEEVYLEEAIFKNECDEILNKEGYHPDTLNDMIVSARKKKNKRVSVMMENHLKNEFVRLIDLKKELAKQFDLESTFVSDIMDEFDGTTRHLYFYLKAISEKRNLPTEEDILKIPRLFVEQPRHVLKRKELKYLDLWQKIISDYNIWGAYQY